MHKPKRLNFRRITWCATNTLEVADTRLLWLMGTKGCRWVHKDWLKQGDRIRITVEKVVTNGNA